MEPAYSQTFVTLSCHHSGLTITLSTNGAKNSALQAIQWTDIGSWLIDRLRLAGIGIHMDLG